MVNKHIPETRLNITSLDKKWFSPAIKIKHCEMQKAFFRHEKSNKLRKLRSVYRKAKKKAIKNFYSEFVRDLKVSNSGQYFKIVK